MDPRKTYEWQQLAKRVCREEPTCWLQLPGCTLVSTTGDHLIPIDERPDLALERSNVRGACWSCNHKRSNMPIEALNLRGHHPPPALGVFD